jgi:hypothetical protein
LTQTHLGLAELTAKHFGAIDMKIVYNEMNLKLKEIAWHATDFDKNGQEQRFDKEAFARMIVRECAGIAKQDGDILKEFGVK